MPSAKKNLIIVESPAKAKTIEKYLGKDYKVQASVGHIRDLPVKKLGVDLQNNFEPEYEVIPGKKKIIDEIKKSAKSANQVLLAPDPDREGEAIAWHVAQVIESIKSPPPVHRILFNEITKTAVKQAVEHPQQINQSMYEAQQARRILDRIVGYQISPLLWDKVRRGLSAGRVQSVAVRLVCEREAEIKKFKAEEYWFLEAELLGSQKPSFVAKLAKKAGKKFELGNEKDTQAVISEIEKEAFTLAKIERKEQKRNPSPPFITAKLQQEAARKLGFSAKKTMMLAQKLYEGVEVDGETAGLITYMRTDSTRIAPTALEEVRSYIKQQYGPDYLPAKPHFYKSKKGAQDAHEAIRPTSMQLTPEKLKKILKKDELKLYTLIWKRFVASQMNPAILDRTTFVIKVKDYEFRASGAIIKFKGFISIYTEGVDEQGGKMVDSAKDEEGKLLPPLQEGETLACQKFLPSQHFTQPPPRFTDASLVKELEEKGIGRPSTYASILSVIEDKKYVEKIEKKFHPTSLGVIVNDLLVQNFPTLLDTAFTAQMEGELDSVEEGKMKWVDALTHFYKTFSETLKKAKVHMKDVKRQEIATDIACEKCQAKMVIKFGRHGEFLACQNYPDCRNTKEFKKDEEGNLKILEQEDTGEVCDKCGLKMVVKRGRYGEFLACSGYPDCKNTKAISIGVDCPKCQKPLLQRRSKRGKTFFGCTGYPDCQFASWDKPVNEKCPDCGSAYLVEKYTKAKGNEVRCPEKGCGFTRELA